MAAAGGHARQSDRQLRRPRRRRRGHRLPAHGWWPTFNLADTYITCGAIALAALTLRPARTGTNSHSETKYDAR